jgi:hypothetical protein
LILEINGWRVGRREMERGGWRELEGEGWIERVGWREMEGESWRDVDGDTLK